MSYALLVPAQGPAYSAFAAQSVVYIPAAAIPQNPYGAATASPFAAQPSPLPAYYGQAPIGFDPFASAVAGTPFAGLAAPSYNPLASAFPSMANPFGSIFGAASNPLASFMPTMASPFSAANLNPVASPYSSLSSIAPLSSLVNNAAADPNAGLSSLFGQQSVFAQPPVAPAPAPANPMQSMLPLLMMMGMGGGGGDMSSILPLMMMMMMGQGGATGSAGAANDPMASLMPLLLMKLLNNSGLPTNELSQVAGDPFATQSLFPTNTLAQTAALPTWSSNSNTGTVAGDPHFTDITNTKGGIDYDVQGESGKIYNILSDKRIQFNSQFTQWNAPGLTVNGTAALRLKTDNGKEVKVKFDAKDVPEVDGKKLAKGDKVSFKMNGKDASVEYTGDKMIITTDEYVIEAKDQGSYLDYSVKTQKDGVLADRVNPHGLLGQTADGDTNIRTGAKGKGAQGEGAIDFKVTDYEVKDLFDDPKAIINRFGVNTRAVADAKGKAIRLYDAQNNLLATADKEGNLVSVRRTVDAQGKVSLTLADGKTKIDESGKIIDDAPAAAAK